MRMLKLKYDKYSKDSKTATTRNMHYFLGSGLSALHGLFNSHNIPSGFTINSLITDGKMKTQRGKSDNQSRYAILGNFPSKQLSVFHLTLTKDKDVGIWISQLH